MGSDAQDEAGDARRAGWGLGTLIVVAALLAAAVFWFLFLREAPPPDDLWAPTTHAYDPECTEECPEILSPRPIGHGGDDGLVFSMRTDPRLDDPIAQWGMCMDSVFSCTGLEIPDGEAERADVLRQCVAQSDCPQACRDRFADRAGTDLDSVVDQFEAVFVAEDAWCAPRQ